MTERVIVRKGAYYDSVTLMLVARGAGELEGVKDVAVVGATPLNLELLQGQGYDLGQDRLDPSDMVIALRTEDDEAAERVLAHIDEQLAAKSRSPGGPGAERRPPKSIVSAARERPELTLAFISVPGRYASYEAAIALEAGLHVFCFSDGVSLEHEAQLKRQAIDRGLLFMGADCGTAIIDGVALGFANAISRGPIGIVGASGTGIQEVSCLLDAAQVGVSQAIGVGGRDLSAEVGGLMTTRALELLGEDRRTQAIVVISKPPDLAVADAVANAARRAKKPTVLAFLGMDEGSPVTDQVKVAPSLESAAACAAELAGKRLPAFDEPLGAPPAEGSVRGLFSGGTLCDEAMQVVAATGSKVASNIPLPEQPRLEDITRSEGHTFIDFGEDELTEGRAHPMIDPTLRNERFEREAADPQTAALLLDVVLGYGAHPDPADELAPLIESALSRRGEELRVIVSLCGAEGDPQGLERQRARLTKAGAVVSRSNAHAARLAVRAAGLKGGAR